MTRDPNKIACDKTLISFLQKLIQDGDTYKKFAWDGSRYVIVLRSNNTYHVTAKGWELQNST